MSNKKVMAAKVLKVGVNKVRIDPGNLERVVDAITKDDIRALIREGAIWAEHIKGISRGRTRTRRASKKKRGRGSGSKKGASGARTPKKRLWVTKVRAIRNRLKKARERGDITGEVFNKLYLQIKGGQIKSVRHLEEQISLMSRRR
ncbi:MAG: 50S ribosomal protein L19e [Candidatus Methylarchaceae archaeon HK02M1]|nr:50S ribosomal protein L19e [Candidatus Methylarchaceae archaeon HK02M1]